MRIISKTEMASVGGRLIDNSGGLSSEIDAMIQNAVDTITDWVLNWDIEIATPLFSIGDFHVTTTGSFQEGLAVAGADCLYGASAVSLGNHAAVTAAFWNFGSSPAAVLGCTVGVGAGLIRDILE